MTEKEITNIKYRLTDLGQQVGELALKYILKLEKENEELKKDLQTAIVANQQWLKRDTRLEEQIEKMENCLNCKFFKEKKYQACIDYKKNNTKCCAFYKWELAE